MECLALLMARRITQQLHLSCSGLVAAIQGVPCSLQDRLEQPLSAIRELHAAFSEANSFQDLSSSVLTQSQRELAVIQEYMEELLDYLKNNTPLSWLVGPFSPRGGSILPEGRGRRSWAPANLQHPHVRDKTTIAVGIKPSVRVKCKELSS